jgi:hypothetical protein
MNAPEIKFETESVSIWPIVLLVVAVLLFFMVPVTGDLTWCLMGMAAIIVSQNMNTDNRLNILARQVVELQIQLTNLSHSATGGGGELPTPSPHREISDDQRGDYP